MAAQIRGRMTRCIVCGEGFEHWSHCAYHVASHLDGDIDLALILTSIELREPSYEKEAK